MTSSASILRRVGLLWCTLAALLACSSSGPPPAVEPGTVSLVFRHGKISGDPRPLQDLIRRFEAENPTIRVRSEPLPSSTDQQHQIYAINLEGGSGGIDVLAMDVIWIAEFSRAGWIRPLNEFFPYKAQASFLPNTIEAVTYRGRVFAVPWNIDAGLLYFRQDLLERYDRPPPRTWSELVETARIVLAGEHNPRLYGFIWQGRQYEGLICNALEFIWGNGGDILTTDRQLTALTSPATRNALAFMRDLIRTYHISPSLVTTADEETSRHLFGNGQAVFTRNWPYAWTMFERAGSPVRGKVGVYPLPTFGNDRLASTLGGWQLGITRDSRHPREAWRFIEFLTSTEVQKILTVQVGMLPTRRALYEDPGMFATQPHLARLGPILAGARPRPVTPFYPMVSQVLQSEFSAVLAGLRDPETALRSAQLQLEPVLRLEAR